MRILMVLAVGMWGCAPEGEPDVLGQPAVDDPTATEPGVPDDSDPPGEPVRAEIGQHALDFTLEEAAGGSLTLSDYDGQVIVLDLSGFT